MKKVLIKNEEEAETPKEISLEYPRLTSDCARIPKGRFKIHLTTKF